MSTLIKIIIIIKKKRKISQFIRNYLKCLFLEVQNVHFYNYGLIPYSTCLYQILETLTHFDIYLTLFLSSFVCDKQLT